MGGAQALKRIPRIKFPQRRPKPSGSTSEPQEASSGGDADVTFFSSLKVPTSLGGKASLQPKRTPLSNEEIEAIMVCAIFLKGTCSLMDDSTGKIKIVLDHLQVHLTAAELEFLRSELADLEDREAQLKAQLAHIDEILRSARLSGYLYIRTRWKPLPGEPPPIDDTDVDDWLPRFVVLHGPCIFYYLMCTDLSPQDSTLLSDIVEVGCLPSFTREDDETRYSFYMLTQQGLRYECSCISELQVDSWLKVLQTDCKLGSSTKAAVNGLSEL